MSKTQERLERAARAVTDACKALVRQVKTISANSSDSLNEEDYSNLPVHEFKVREMEAQVDILKLEKQLTAARRTLADLRRAGYHADAT